MRLTQRLSRNAWLKKLKMKNIIENYLRSNGFRAFCPKAVLFDMDGVLFDSMPNHAVSWHKAMEYYGILMDEYG